MGTRVDPKVGASPAHTRALMLMTAIFETKPDVAEKGASMHASVSQVDIYPDVAKGRATSAERSC